jgi:hypothetical protein
MRELDYLTRDDEPEDESDMPDFLKEDPDPKAFDNWGNTGADWEAEAHAAEMAETEGDTTGEPAQSGSPPPAKPDAPGTTGERRSTRHPPHPTTRTAGDAAKEAKTPSKLSRLCAFAKRCVGR